MALKERARCLVSYQGVHFVGKDFVKCVGVVSQGDPAVGGDVVDVNVLVDVDDKLALGVNLHQNLLLVHRFHNFADVRPLLLLQKERQK